MEGKQASLLEALQGIDYPATGSDIVAHARERGIDTVKWGQGQVAKLTVIFDRYPTVTFTSDEDVTNAVVTTEVGIRTEAGPQVRDRDLGIPHERER
jgi:hypothetical protein